MVTLMGEATQRVVSLWCRVEGGAFVGSREVGIAHWPDIPRKLTRCQYVVASGEMQCINNASATMMPRAQAHSLFPSLAAADPAIAEALTPGGWLATLKQHAERSRAGDPDADKLFANVVACFGTNRHYLGAPIRVGGRVVGAMCAWFTEEAALEVAGRRALLEQQAELVAGVLEAL